MDAVPDAAAHLGELRLTAAAAATAAAAQGLATKYYFQAWHFKPFVPGNHLRFVPDIS
jgi:hypothetical protein